MNPINRPVNQSMNPLNHNYRLLSSILFLILVFVWMPVVIPAEDESFFRVARISYTEGEVTMERTIDESWVDATINTPLFAGDKIYTGVNGRVEIQLEDEVVVRLDRQTFVHFEALDEKRTRIGVVQGIVAINARPLEDSRPPMEINTSYFTALISRHAKVRVQALENQPAEIRVHKGSLDLIEGQQGIRQLHTGDTLKIYGPNQYMSIAVIPNPDEFDLWGDLRDVQDAASQSPQYVTSSVSGYSDLDRYGDWIDVKDYDQVWRPRVIDKYWTPYRDGRWVHRQVSGWVWVSEEPWGWVPYHYGRWVNLDHFGWCWVPIGVSRNYRPVWSPALVAFTYSDRGSHFKFSLGGHYYDHSCVGWFPLGPSDYGYHGYHYGKHYRHPYHYYSYLHPHRRHYLHDGHHDGHHGKRDHHGDWDDDDKYDDTKDDDRDYENQNVPNAVSVVPTEDFGKAKMTRFHRTTIKNTDSIHAIQAGIDSGINWIDTAPVYGFGRSETVVGQAIQGRREQVFVVTKCGLLPDGQGGAFRRLKAESIKEELEGSLKRLNVDVIDLYQIHWPNPEEEIEEAWEVITDAIQQGKVCHGGVSNFNVKQMKRLKAIAPVSSLQPSYSMLDRSVEEEILPYCRQEEIGVLAYSPMASGVLTGKMTPQWVASLPEDDWRKAFGQEFKEPQLTHNIEFVETVLRPIAQAHGVDPGQIGVAWTLRKEVVTSSIVGARNPNQINKTVRAADVQLTTEEVDLIEQGLEQREKRIVQQNP